MTKKLNIKSILKEIVIGVLIIFILTNIISYFRQPKLSSNYLPSIEVKLLNRQIYTVNRDKPLILHFWATWCHACQLEIANIEHLSKEYEVLTIVVNSGDDNAIQKYMNNKELTFRVLNDYNGEWAKKFNVEAYPTTFIYDAKGELKFTEVGYTSTVGFLARMAFVKE